jgi:ADP-ribose pyrophosphatase YjhB (NUDIX family)
MDSVFYLRGRDRSGSMKNLARRAVERTARLALPLVARVTRPLTMGVRAMILDSEGRVCLVRHSYQPGWHMPGGAVEPRETLHQALLREVHEETGLAVTGSPELFGVYLNEAMARRDHVVLYVVRGFEMTDRRPSAWEIVEHGFHPLDALPPDTTGPTRRRLAEVLEGRPPDHLW